MQLFTGIGDVEEYLEKLDTDLDRIDCLDYLILELEEKTNNESVDLSGKEEDLITESTMVPGLKADEWERRIGIWRTLLTKLRKSRDKLYRANLEAYQRRLESSWPEGNRLRFPICTSLETLKRNIRLLNEIGPHKTHEFLVWHLLILESAQEEGWRLIETETWRMILDARDRGQASDQHLWEALGISDEFYKSLKEQEQLSFRATQSLQKQLEPEATAAKIMNAPGYREPIPWLGTLEQLETLVGLLFQNHLIENEDKELLIGQHFHDTINGKRFPLPDGVSPDPMHMIQWTGVQAQLRYLFEHLVHEELGKLVDWEGVRYSFISQHFYNHRAGKVFAPKNLKRIPMDNFSEKRAMVIRSIFGKLIGKTPKPAPPKKFPELDQLWL